MNIDFDKAMSIYELIALIVSVIAILIPIIGFVWKKWIIQTNLTYHPTGKCALFFNQSGSYVRIDGVVEAERKATTVKKMLVKITRDKDNRQLNLEWSSFISPVNQKLVGNYLQTTEIAHPFRVDADSVCCAFVEYCDPSNSFIRTFTASTSSLFSKISEMQILSSSYDEAVEKYKSLPEYISARSVIANDYIWEIGKYTADIEIFYGKKSKHFIYSFSIGEHERNSLVCNIDEALLTPLKQAYAIPFNYVTPTVDLYEK